MIPAYPVTEDYENRQVDVKFDRHLSGEYDAAVQEAVRQLEQLDVVQEVCNLIRMEIGGP